MNHRHTTFTASSITTRSVTLAMALALTLGLLGGMGQLAQHEQGRAETLLASAQPTQVVVITGQRMARA